MSIGWMRRTHAMMPLTRQEEAVRNLLIEERLSFEAHHVFELPDSSVQRGLSVDFLVFIGGGVAIECTACNRNRGSALAELRRRSAFMDYRFGLLKASFPRLVCGAFVEAPSEDQEQLGRQLKPILRNSNFVATSNVELRDSLSKKRGEC
jgi:hypothetical protein